MTACRGRIDHTQASFRSAVKNWFYVTSWLLNPTGIKLLWDSCMFALCLRSHRAAVAWAVLGVAGLLLHPTQASKLSCRTQEVEKKARSPHLLKYFLHF